MEEEITGTKQGTRKESEKPHLFLALGAIEFYSPAGTKRLHRVPETTFKSVITQAHTAE